MIKATATTHEEGEERQIGVQLAINGSVMDTIRELSGIVNAVIRATYQNCPDGMEADVTLLFAEKLADSTKQAFDAHMELMKEAKQ